MYIIFSSITLAIEWWHGDFLWQNLIAWNSVTYYDILRILWQNVTKWSVKFCDKEEFVWHFKTCLHCFFFVNKSKRKKLRGFAARRNGHVGWGHEDEWQRACHDQSWSSQCHNPECQESTWWCTNCHFKSWFPTQEEKEDINLPGVFPNLQLPLLRPQVL